MSKLSNFLKDPVLNFNVAIKRHLSLPLRQKVFAHKVEFRSESENGNYGSVVVEALKNQNSFDNFKRNPAYREILEHVNQDQGQKYLDIVLSRNDGLFDAALESVFELDQVGNPVKFNYTVRNRQYLLSPTTLRYLKVASDINGLFGSQVGRIAEVGCGYGGQALVNDQLLQVNTAILFDLPFVNSLISRYLNSMLLNGAFRTTTINESNAENYDLVISNYAFSELPSALQMIYIKKVLACSKCGYLTMNSGLLGNRSIGKVSLKQLRELLPSFEIYEEEPNTYQFNYIIVWGHNKSFADKYLTLKQTP